jgi:hypothetical protein
MKEHDEDLERRFAELRAWDRRAIPSFEALVGRPRRPSRAPLLAVAALVITVAAIALLPRLRGARSDAVGIADWQSPTASLLVVPGSDLLHTVPSISESVIHLEEQ